MSAVRLDGNLSARLVELFDQGVVNPERRLSSGQDDPMSRIRGNRFQNLGITHPNSLFMTGVTKGAAKVATGELESLGVFGNDYDTPDGTGVRDYIHVVDLADGHVKALDYAARHKGVLEVNLGTGKGSSVLEILHAYERACGHELAYQIKPRRAGDLPAFYADTTKAKELLGWEARFTIEEMCRDSWNFVKRQMEEAE